MICYTFSIFKSCCSEFFFIQTVWSLSWSSCIYIYFNRAISFIIALDFWHTWLGRTNVFHHTPAYIGFLNRFYDPFYYCWVFLSWNHASFQLGMSYGFVKGDFWTVDQFEYLCFCLYLVLEMQIIEPFNNVFLKVGLFHNIFFKGLEENYNIILNNLN